MPLAILFCISLKNVENSTIRSNSAHLPGEASANTRAEMRTRNKCDTCVQRKSERAFRVANTSYAVSRYACLFLYFLWFL